MNKDELEARVKYHRLANADDCMATVSLLAASNESVAPNCAEFLLDGWLTGLKPAPTAEQRDMYAAYGRKQLQTATAASVSAVDMHKTLRRIGKKHRRATGTGKTSKKKRRSTQRRSSSQSGSGRFGEPRPPPSRPSEAPKEIPSDTSSLLTGWRDEVERTGEKWPSESPPQTEYVDGGIGAGKVAPFAPLLHVARSVAPPNDKRRGAVDWLLSTSKSEAAGSDGERPARVATAMRAAVGDAHLTKGVAAETLDKLVGRRVLSRDSAEKAIARLFSEAAATVSIAQLAAEAKQFMVIKATDKGLFYRAC